MTAAWEAFKAFNINAFSSLFYMISSNWWSIIIIICCVLSVIMYIHAEIEVTVKEDQRVL